MTKKEPEGFYGQLHSTYDVKEANDLIRSTEWRKIQVTDKGKLILERVHWNG